MGDLQKASCRPGEIDRDCCGAGAVHQCATTSGCRFPGIAVAVAVHTIVAGCRPCDTSTCRGDRPPGDRH